MIVKWLGCILLFLAACSAEKIEKSGKTQWDFHQNDYDIKMERANTEWFNHSYFSSAKAELVPYNRTQRAYNGSMYLLVDISGDVKMDIQVYKFMSNEYRFFPITISLEACKEFQLNAIHIRDLLAKISNFQGCPITKGFYYIRNFVPDFSRFPPYMLRGDYKLTSKWYHRSNYLMEVDFYGSVKDKPIKWQI